MSATELAGLYISIDSTSAKSADADLRRLEATSESLGQKAAKMCTAVNIALGYLAVKSKSLIQETTLLAARYDTLGTVMNVAGRNAGYTANQMAQFEEQLKKTGISALESRQQLATMATANIDLAQSSKLARAAQDLAVVGNINSSEAFSRLIHGIQTGNTLTLRTLGLNIQFKESNEEVAKSLGKTVKQLTQQDKVQARANQVLQEAGKYFGIYEGAMENAGKKAQSMTRYVEDLKVAIGGAFQPAYGAMIDSLKDKVEGMTRAVEGAKRSGDMQRWGETIKGAMDMAGGAIGGTTKLIWQNREAVVALGMTYAAAKTIKGVAGTLSDVKTKWESIQASIRATQVNKLEKASEVELIAVKRLKLAAMYDEAIAEQQQGILNLKALRDKELITAAGFQEAVAHRTNAAAILNEQKAQAMLNGGKVGLLKTVTSFIGPMGLLTIAVAGAGMAYSAYRRELEEAADAQERLRQKQFEDARDAAQRVEAINQQSGAVGKSAEAQAKYNREITELIRRKPQYENIFKKNNAGDYLSDEATKMAAHAQALKDAGEEYRKAMEEWKAAAAECDKLANNKSLLNDLTGGLMRLNPTWWFLSAEDKALAEKSVPGRLFTGQEKDAEKLFNQRKARVDEAEAFFQSLKDAGREEADRKRLQGMEAAAEAAKKAAEARKSYIDSLKEEIALHGKNAAETLKHHAAKHKLTEANSELVRQRLEQIAADEREKELKPQTDFIEKLKKENEAFEIRKYTAMQLIVHQAELNHLNEKALLLAQAQGAVLTENEQKYLEQIKAARERLKIVEEQTKRESKLEQQLEEFHKQRHASNDLKAKYESPDAKFARELEKLNSFKFGSDIVYLKALADLRHEHQKLRADAGDIWAEIGLIVSDNSRRAGDSIVGWMNNMDGLGRTWQTLGDTVRSVIADMILQLQKYVMEQYVMNAAMAGLQSWGNSKGGIAQLIFGGIVGAAAGGFKGATGVTGVNVGGTGIGIGSLSGTRFDYNFNPQAAGGSVLAGTTYLVGERGPELFEAPATGRIIPNNQLGGRGGGDVTVSIVQNIHSDGRAETQTSGTGSSQQQQVWAGMAKQMESIAVRAIQKEKRLGGELNRVYGG